MNVDTSVVFLHEIANLFSFPSSGWILTFRCLLYDYRVTLSDSCGLSNVCCFFYYLFNVVFYSIVLKLLLCGLFHVMTSPSFR
jgi:hypothetical protein